MATDIATTLAAMSVLGILAQWGRHAWRWGRRLAETIEATHARSAQLEPNGGSSLRDDVTAVRKGLAEVQSVLEDHGRQIRELQDRRRTWL